MEEKESTDTCNSYQLQSQSNGKRRADKPQDDEQSRPKRVAASSEEIPEEGAAASKHQNTKPTTTTSRPKTKRIRVTYTAHQLATLAQLYERSHYVSYSERVKLAEVLNLSEKQVKVWFQNQRTKEKKQLREKQAAKQQLTYTSDSGPGGSPINELTYQCENKFSAEEGIPVPTQHQGLPVQQTTLLENLVHVLRPNGDDI